MKEYIIVKPKILDFLQIKILGIKYIRDGITSFIPFFQLLKTSIFSKETLVVKKGKRVIGYTYTFNLFSEESFIQQFCVDKKYRNKKVGTDLMKEILNLLKSQGYKKVELRTHKNNKKMIGLCKKFGFFKSKKVFFKNKYLMVKQL